MADNILTVDVFKSELEKFRVEVDRRLTKMEQQVQDMRAEIRKVATEVQVNAIKIDGLNNSLLSFVIIMAIAIGIISFFLTLARIFSFYRRETTTLTADDVRNLIRDELARLNVNNPIPQR